MKHSKERKERRYKWTDVPNPKCRLCKAGKLHTQAQHALSVKRYNDNHSIFDGWIITLH